jgi:hypothetical protein
MRDDMFGVRETVQESEIVESERNDRFAHSIQPIVLSKF